MKLKRGLDVLKTSKIYFPKPTELNDPFDSKIPVHDDIPVDQFISATFKECIALGQTWSEIKKLIDSCVDDTGQYIVKTKENNKKLYHKFTSENNNAGILSLTEDPFSLLMWAHYAENHNGICLGFDAKSGFLAEYDVLGKVLYSDILPHASFGEILKRDGSLTNKIFFTKYKDWSYEKEWRLMANRGGMSHIIPSGISEVYIGLGVSKEQCDNVLKICSALKIKPTVYKCKTCNGKFSLITEQLNYE